MAEILAEEKTKIININEVQITGYRVVTFPIENRGMGVDYVTGYDLNGKFIPVEKGYKEIIGADFDTMVSSKPSADISFYENIKAILYRFI